MGKRNYTTVSIPKSLAKTIKLRIQGTEFTSTSSYVTHILTEIEKEIEKMEDGQGKE
ncbi:CopG family transcriptional regulator [Candidatus Bathyarchaeota archaeon]|nr:CopG family transcriptional regulator [Candidatus Bathyarchaeota archaeon]